MDDDITYAPLRLDQVEAVARLTNRGYTASEIPVGMTATEVAELFDEPHHDPQYDTMVASIGGEPVAWCGVWNAPSEERQERAFVFGQTDPDHRRRGIGGRLIRWGVARAEDRLRSRQNDLPKFIRMDAAPKEDDKRRIMETLGMTVVRYFDTMNRPLGDDLPTVSTHGFAVVPWDRARAGDAHAVAVAAFRDHWGSAPIDRQTWDAWMGREGTRLDLSFLAMDGESVIGYCVNAHHQGDYEVHGRHEAWVESLGTLREHRGRGVATALLGASMHAMRNAGFEWIGLDVDSANPTGAHGLYTRLGFTVRFRSTMYELEVR